MKKIFFSVLSILFVSTTAFGVEVNPANTIPQNSVSGVNIQMSSASVDNVLINDTEYKAGDEVNGSFTVTNHGDSVLKNLSYRVLIGSDYEEINKDLKITNTFLDATSLSSVGDVSGGETKKIIFKYKVPQFIKGSKLAVHINLYSINSVIMNQGSSHYITVANNSNRLSVTNAKLILDNNKEYDLTEGPTIYKDKDPKTAHLSVNLENNSLNQLSINPLINVYNQHDKSEKLDIKQNPIILKAGELKKVSIDLPVFEYTPAVYFAEILLNDEKGNQLATRIGVRYIVAGDIAALHDISSNKSQVKFGDEFILNFLVSGRPFDIEIVNQMLKKNGASVAKPEKPGIGKINIVVLNELDDLVANYSDTFDLSQDKKGPITLSALKDAKAMKAVVSVYNKDGVLLMRQESKLSDDYDKVSGEEKSSKTVRSVTIIIGITLIIVIGIVLFRRRKINISTLSFIIFASAVALPITANGWIYTNTYYGCSIEMYSPPGVTIYTPYDNSHYVEGATIALSGNVTFEACTNSTNHLILNFYNSGDGSTGDRQFHYTEVSGGHTTYQDSDTFTTRSVSVGDKAGAQKISFYITDGCYIISGYVPYYVHCATGRVPNSYGVCSVPPPVPGVCGGANGLSKITSWPAYSSYCSVGSMSGGVLSGTTYAWSCLGTHGGSNANCSLTTDSLNEDNPDVPCVGCNGGGGGGGGGCPSGTYYCELVQQCLSNADACNSGTAAEYFELNPNIAADEVGSVSFKSLEADPELGNKGYSCVIDWSTDVFKTYDYFTRCVFSTATETVSFSPGSTTAPVSHSIDNIIKDTVPKMTCTQIDSGDVSSIETACRVNWSAVEVN